MGLKLASARAPRQPGWPELALGATPRSRLVPLLFGILLGCGYIAIEAGASWMTASSAIVGALVLLVMGVAGFVRRRLRVVGATLVLDGTLFGLGRVSDVLAHNSRVWIGATPIEAHTLYRRRVPVQVRIVGEQGRLTWHVRGSSAAARELELLREFLPRAGVELLGDDAVLAGGIDVNHNAERTLLSWRARLPTTDRRGVLLLALVPLLLLALSRLPGPSPAVAAVNLSLLVGSALVLAIVAVRARRARAGIEVDDLGWQLARSGILGTHRYPGGRALLPGRVVGLRGPLPLESSLQLREGSARVLDPTELSPPEMRWLTARVVDRLERDHHGESRRAARLVV